MSFEAFAADAATTTAVEPFQRTVTTVGLQIDWTLSVGNIGTAIVFIIGMVIVFVRLQSRVTAIDTELKSFRQGLQEFQTDFKQMGAQVVAALVAIARLEGREGTPPQQSTLFPWDFRERK